MKTRFQEIEDFVNSLCENSEIGIDQSILLIGGSGSARSTAVDYMCNNYSKPGCGMNEGCTP